MIKRTLFFQNNFIYTYIFTDRVLRLCKTSMCICGFICFYFPYSFCSKKDYVMARNNYAQLQREHKTNYASRFVTELVQDVFLLHKNLFHSDSLKVVAPVLPTVLGTYCYDKKIQSYFYDPRCHKNINQFPRWTRELTRYITLPIIALFGIQGLLSRDDDLFYTAKIMLAGVPILVFMNQLIKKMNVEICYRPWHEDFSYEKRSLGGFPSGHLSHATYLAVLYGVRHGYRYALPLGCMSMFIGAVFLSCNRHYLSQLCAGVGFGALYGLAATKVVDYRLSGSITVAPAVDNNSVGINLSWQF